MRSEALDRACAIHPVVLANQDDASGLADLLHQFLTQTLEEPDKRRAARRLRGSLLFCAAEDAEIRVCITFSAERVHLADAGDTQPRGPRLTADFLSTAHLTTGEASPFALLLRRRIKARFGPGHVLFLLRFLALMRISADGQSAAPARRWQWPLALVAAACAIGLYLALTY